MKHIHVLTSLHVKGSYFYLQVCFHFLSQLYIGLYDGNVQSMYVFQEDMIHSIFYSNVFSFSL